MPTYDYQCDSCGHKLEEFQSMTAKPLKKCPQCQRNSLKRLIGTGAGIIFKGSGFWQTDYRSENYKQGEKADSDATADKSDAPDKSGSSEKSDASTDKSGQGSSEDKSKTSTQEGGETNKSGGNTSGNASGQSGASKTKGPSGSNE